MVFGNSEDAIKAIIDDYEDKKQSWSKEDERNPYDWVVCFRSPPLIVSLPILPVDGRHPLS